MFKFQVDLLRRLEADNSKRSKPMFSIGRSKQRKYTLFAKETEVTLRRSKTITFAFEQCIGISGSAVLLSNRSSIWAGRSVMERLRIYSR